MPTPPFVDGDLYTRPVTSGMFNPFNGHMMAATYNVDEVFRHNMSVEDQLHFLYRLFISGQYVDGEKVAEYLNKLYEFCRYLEKYIQELDDREAAHYTELTNKISDLDAKVERYNTEIRNLISKLDAKVENYYSTLTTRIDNLTQTVQNNYSTLNKKIDDSVTTINNRIDQEVNNLTKKITQQGGQVTNISNSVNNMIDNVYGVTKNEDGTLKFPTGTKIPVANLNWFSATASPTNATYANAIRSRALSDNDVKAV